MYCSYLGKSTINERHTGRSPANSDQSGLANCAFWACARVETCESLAQLHSPAVASPWPPGILQSFFFPFLPWELPQKSGVCEDLAHSGLTRVELVQVLPQRPPAPQGRRGR